MLYYVSNGKFNTIRKGGKRTNVNSKPIKFIYINIYDGGQLILNTHIHHEINGTTIRIRSPYFATIINIIFLQHASFSNNRQTP